MFQVIYSGRHEDTKLFVRMLHFILCCIHKLHLFGCSYICFGNLIITCYIQTLTLDYSSDRLLRPVRHYCIQTCLDNFVCWLETFYWFGDNNYTEWEEVFNRYKPPPYRLPQMTGAYSFGVAGNYVTSNERARYYKTYLWP